jgi:uncharacterized protein YciW
MSRPERMLDAVASGTFADDDGVTQEVIAGVTRWAESDPDLQRPEVARLFGRTGRSRPAAVRSRKPSASSGAPRQRRSEQPELPSWWSDVEPIRRSDDELELTARHESAHAAAAYLLDWEVTWVRLHAFEGQRKSSSGVDQVGYTSVLTPERRDATTRALQYATICLAARTHVGWTAEDANRNAVSYRTDRRQAWQALARVTPGDPRRTGDLFERAEAYARQLANDPTFRSIAKRVAGVLLKRGDLSGREFNQLAARGSKGRPPVDRPPSSLTTTERNTNGIEKQVPR